MNEDVLIWVHGDCLNPHSAAFQRYENRSAVFVFDENWKVSLKRIMFMYECLLEIPDIQIRTGDVMKELLSSLEENRCQRLVTVASVSPDFTKIITRLKQNNISLEILPAPAFVSLSAEDENQLDLKRFSRYWQSVKRHALSLNESLF